MEVLADMTGGPGGAQLLFLAGLGLVIIILLMRSRRYFRQVTQFHTPTARPPRKVDRPKVSSAPPRDLDKWEVSMHELARDLSGQLDMKIRVLELLIREADEAARRLEAAVRGQGTGGKGQVERDDGRAARGEASEVARPVQDQLLPSVLRCCRKEWPRRYLRTTRRSRSKSPAIRGSNGSTPSPTPGCRPPPSPTKSAARWAKSELILSLRGTRRRDSVSQRFKIILRISRRCRSQRSAYLTQETSNTLRP